LSDSTKYTVPSYFDHDSKQSTVRLTLNGSVHLVQCLMAQKAKMNNLKEDQHSPVNGPLFLKSWRIGPKVHFNQVDLGEDIELEVLVGEFLTRCDPIIRNVFYRRMQGGSWKGIARAHAISTHAAESKFSQVRRRLRKTLGRIEGQ
jgi:hypothetical protein